MRCDQCKFWEGNAIACGSTPEQEDDYTGECKRHAPIAFMPRHVLVAIWATNKTMDDKQANTAQWPQTEPDDWCGEFQPKGSKPPVPNDISIEAVLSSRVLTCLHRWNEGHLNQIHFLSDLTKVTAYELLELRGFADVSLGEVREQLQLRGMYLRTENPHES